MTKVAGTKLQSIAAFGTKMKTVVQAVDALDQNIRLRAVTRIAHARFVAAAILLRKFGPDVEQRLLSKWERVTFRIFGLGGADTRYKVGDYVRLGYQIGADGIDLEAIDAGLAALGKDWGLDDIITGSDYWSNCYEGWTEELRYLLYRYDEYLAAENNIKFEIIEWNKVWSDDAARSIEHIQPQSSNAKYIHNLGNLTMLAPRVNSSLQDKAPALKAATYRTCGLIATRAVGEIIEGGTEWDEAAVRERASKIEVFVRKEWAD